MRNTLFASPYHPRPEINLNPEGKAALPLLTVEARVSPKMAYCRRKVCDSGHGRSFVFRHGQPHAGEY